VAGVYPKEQMNNDELNELRETLRRHDLSRGEWQRLRAQLDGHGVDASAWTEERALTGLLNRLPDAPLPSNFSARVLQALDRAPASVGMRFRLRSWWARHPAGIQLASSAACLLLLLLGYARYQSVRRERMVASVTSVVRSVEAASALAELPPVDILQDYDAIQGLSRSRVAADEELLVALEVN